MAFEIQFKHKTIRCTNYRDYKDSHRALPFTLAYATLNYESDKADESFINRLMTSGERLARSVNPAAANDAACSRGESRLLNNAVAGLLAEYCWKKYINTHTVKPIADYTEFTEAATQIDLYLHGRGKKIEIRSSFPRNGIVFSLCHSVHQFDILGPYTNTVKPGEIQKDFYVRTLYHIPKGTSFLDLLKKNTFHIYLTGGATWKMMTDDAIAKNKDLKPDDAIHSYDQNISRYRVVPFSKALDTPAIVSKMAGEKE
ncbi:MAG: hypothetical protein K9J27_11065 [Bacteroidales bacterium]|nr:hypothetical protein [Bacteroidales bacterium]MCF8334403.1 hypothetical protein [Bacteroidales bacterium]